MEIGNINKSYLNIAPKIAEMNFYQMDVLGHLFSLSISHYDPEIRKLSSLSLGSLIDLNSDYFKYIFRGYLL